MDYALQHLKDGGATSVEQGWAADEIERLRATFLTHIQRSAGCRSRGNPCSDACECMLVFNAATVEQKVDK